MQAVVGAIELDAPDNSEDNCSTDAVYTTIFGGEFIVDFDFGSVPVGNTVDEAVLTVIYIPFNGTGGRPTLPIVMLGGESDNG